MFNSNLRTFITSPTQRRVAGLHLHSSLTKIPKPLEYKEDKHLPRLIIVVQKNTIRISITQKITRIVRKTYQEDHFQETITDKSVLRVKH